MFKNIFYLSLSSCILMGCTSNNQHNYSFSQQKLPLEATYNNARSLNNFNDFVDFLKKKAAGSGVADQVLASQGQIFYVEKAVSLDRKQAARRRDPSLSPPPPNPNGVTHYLNKVLTQAKVDKALELWWQYQPQLNYASQKYGVPKNYLIALWGMESSFGHYTGNFDVLSVLATLAFDGRREKLFTQEFVNAMKMLQDGTIKRSEMRGSWAGAMGQTQFMPTAYLRYAADGNRDQKKDIWHEHFDVFASIASYLSQVGWNDKLPWGVEVKLSQPVELSVAGIEANKARSLQEWQSFGVYLAYPNAQENEKFAALAHDKVWLVRPDGELGRAFLVSNNYRTLMNWNNSNNFAVSIGKFVDRISAGIEQ